ncbi:LacI family transcriptional regulator [Bryobacterales bacterium F-183]|nr:LacI family transcriptional regulator [Bryobacterales bacterium F-183]
MTSIPRHQQVFESLRQAILTGKYEPGHKLPSEAMLVRQFGASRITIGRALRDLQSKGFVERRAGSGTYVRANKAPAATGDSAGYTFGLLIPELGQTEIFEPICQGMSQSTRMTDHVLLWGHSAPSASPQENALQMCRQFVNRRVTGVFFAPFEWGPDRDRVNQQILEIFDGARIRVILLDRDALPYPRRSAVDLVGIDNRRAGFLAADHLLNQGAKNLAFVALPHSAATVDARIAGFHEALLRRNAAIAPHQVWTLDPRDANAVQQSLQAFPADGILAANDRTAGHLMHTLLNLGHRIPAHIRVTGFDDTGYAALLPVPLTTVRQPCREVGEAAISAMLERVANPGLPPREILLDSALIIRSSS